MSTCYHIPDWPEHRCDTSTGVDWDDEYGVFDRAVIARLRDDRERAFLDAETAHDLAPRVWSETWAQFAARLGAVA